MPQRKRFLEILVAPHEYVTIGAARAGVREQACDINEKHGLGVRVTQLAELDSTAEPEVLQDLPGRVATGEEIAALQERLN